MPVWWKNPRVWSITVIAVAATAVAVLIVLYQISGLSWADQFASSLGPPLGVVSLAGPLAVYLWRKGSAASSTSDDQLNHMAESIAEAQKRRWETEELARRVFDPWPLPVRWGVTERADAVMVDWPAIRGRAGAGPLPLDGTYGQIADAFTHPESPGRLVILGEPGAGKSMLALRLTLDLLARRTAGDPVPVLLSVATWNPSEPLDEWIAARLATEHRELASALRAADGRRRTRARELIDTARILPVLDGLDEMAKNHHQSALVAIADTLRPDRQIVVTSRTAEYELAVAAGKLARTPVVEILPLASSDVARYLTESTEKPERWKRVLEHLDRTDDRPLWQALSTPLMLSLARTVYDSQASRPDDLITAAWARERAGIERHLLGALIPAAYTSPVGNQPRLDKQKADRAQRWLTNIAVLLHTHGGGPDISWWHLRSATVVVQWCLTAVLAALWIVTGARNHEGLVLVQTPLFVVVLLTTIRARHPRQVNLSFNRRKVARLVVALLLGVAAGLISGPPPDALVIPLAAISLWYMLEAAFFPSDGPIGTVVTAADAGRSVSPLSVLRRDRALALWLATVVSSAIVIGMMAVAIASPPSRTWPTGSERVVIFLWLAVFLLAFGLIVGSVAGLSATAWGQFCVVRLLLAVQGRTPMRLMSFLDDAHRRGILRQAGAVYQFRHGMLQQQLVKSAQGQRLKQSDSSISDQEYNRISSSFRGAK
ncbi:NACHT domain-containing protein [Paractinoplanes maris]|uniref:NACHT domain-containing protein n=1 Tax=Paractinoplanes maris TaxID=1734446 RepID=UPI002021E1D6|nr:NACHT domain-containing protein [Actinoplanes maris]